MTQMPRRALGMQVFGDLDGQVQFDAASQDVEALAWIVDVPALEQRLAEAVRYQPQVEIVKEPVEAALTAVCEAAPAARAPSSEWTSPSRLTPNAIATRLDCEISHCGIARQWFTPEGILAFLPMGATDGHEVAVVWSLEQALVPEWLNSDAESLPPVCRPSARTRWASWIWWRTAPPGRCSRPWPTAGAAARG